MKRVYICLFSISLFVLLFTGCQQQERDTDNADTISSTIGNLTITQSGKKYNYAGDLSQIISYDNISAYKIRTNVLSADYNSNTNFFTFIVQCNNKYVDNVVIKGNFFLNLSTEDVSDEYNSRSYRMTYYLTVYTSSGETKILYSGHALNVGINGVASDKYTIDDYVNHVTLRINANNNYGYENEYSPLGYNNSIKYKLGIDLYSILPYGQNGSQL
jgi:hypothetical protein